MIQASLASGDYEGAGDAVLNARRRFAFLNSIEDEYGDEKLVGQQLVGAVAILPRLAAGPVITTNFDHVLETAFRTEHADFEHIVCPDRAEGVYQALMEDRHYLLKLHGDVSDRGGWIFTHEDYERCYAPDSPLCQILEALFSTRSLLFIGCSLASDRWMRLLGSVVARHNFVGHFALVEYPENDAEYSPRQQFLSDHGITPIWFLHNRFDMIQMILESVAPLAASPSERVRRNHLLTGANDPLVAHTTGFLGRTNEVTAILQFLHEADGASMQTTSIAPKIYLVEGAPGIGKSEVCKEALQRFLHDYPTKLVYYVELVDVHGELGMLACLAEALNLPPTTIRDDILAAIAAKPCVLYMDNLEDLLSDGNACDTLAKLVDLTGVHVLASSREHMAQFGCDLPILQLDPGAAIELFMSEWKRSAPKKHLTDSPELRGFVLSELDCHALSIVLVAAQAYQTPSLSELIRQWKQGKATDLARLPRRRDRLSALETSLERSLAAVQNASADALTLWGLCALFPDGMSPAAFDAVTASFADQRFLAREVLLRLNIMRFPQSEELGPNAVGGHVSETTLLMLTPLRRFILEKAQDRVVGLNVDGLLDAAFAYFTGLASAAQQTEQGDDGAVHRTALDRLLSELPNMRQAMALAAKAGPRWAEPLGRLNHMLSISYKHNTLVSAEILSAILPSRQPMPDTVDTAHTLEYLGDAEERLGEKDRARKHYKEASALYRKKHANLGLANVLTSLGGLEDGPAEGDRARKHYKEASALYRNEYANLGRANALKGLGDLERRRGEMDGARQHYEKAIKLYTEERDDLGRANALTSLAGLEAGLLDIILARQHYKRAIQLYEKEHANLGHANALKGLGDLERRLSEIDGARQHYEKAIKLYTEERDDLGRANVFKGLGDLERRRGEMDGARQHYEKAIKLYTEERDDLGRANVFKDLGDLDRLCGKTEQARQNYKRAIELYMREHNDRGLANVYTSLFSLRANPRGDGK